MQRLGFHSVMGLVVLVIGASIAVDLVFDVHLPLVRIALAALFIAWSTDPDRPPLDDVTITVDARFGVAVVKVDPAIAYDIHGSSVCGEVRMPDRSMTAMGILDFHGSSEQPPRLHLRRHAMFGACQVVEASRSEPVSQT